MPQARTATVAPPTPSAPRWAAAVDPDRGAGDHRRAGRGEPRAELACHVRAVPGGGPGAHHGDRSITQLTRRPRAAHPQRHRRGERRGAAEHARRERLARPGGVLGHEQPRARGVRGRQVRACPVDRAAGGGLAGHRIGHVAGPDPGRGLAPDRRPRRRRPTPARGVRPPGTGTHEPGAPRGAALRTVPPRRSCAALRSRKYSACSTLSRSGRVSPRRSPTVQATRNARSAPRAVSSPLRRPASSGRDDRRGEARTARGARGRAPPRCTASRARPSARRPPPGGQHPGPDRRGVLAGSPTADRAVTGYMRARRSTRSSSGPDSRPR